MNVSNIVDFIEFKKKRTRQHEKPFFKNKNVMITIKAEGEKKKYLILANIVLNKKQIIAMERLDQDEKNIGIAEAIIEDGKVSGVHKISEQEFKIASKIFDDMIEDIGKKD
jgi:hypothetical protein